jgi:hypothetical protein
MNVAILTIEQKDQLVGEQYANDSYFNPILDANDKWVISEEEINFCTNDNFSWIKNLELEDYKPINNDL